MLLFLIVETMPKTVTCVTTARERPRWSGKLRLEQQAEKNCRPETVDTQTVGFAGNKALDALGWARWQRRFDVGFLGFLQLRTLRSCVIPVSGTRAPRARSGVLP